MRYGIVTLALVAAVSSRTLAQPNPFKLPRSNIKAQVTYQLTGDQKGTSETAFDGSRMMTKSSSTIKMMGKETKASEWTMVTEDSMYTANLDKKEGLAGPNLLPHYAKAYDGLDGAGKQRFHANLKEMGALMSKAFNVGSMGSLGDKLGEQTIAGEVCENRKFASFEVCTMKRGPQISLRTAGDLVCFRFEQTATSVSLSAPPSSAWERPVGIEFKPMLGAQDADSAARGMVGYLASQPLSDSIAAAKAELAKAKAEAVVTSDPKAGEPHQMTDEEKAQMKQACEMLKNFDMSKVLANALKGMAKALGNAAVDAAKQGATSKLKGLLKRPRIP